MKKKVVKGFSLLLVLVMLLSSLAVTGLGATPLVSENVHFSETFENGISGWAPNNADKVSFTLEAGKAETNALKFNFSYDASVSYNWDKFPMITSAQYGVSVGEATHLAFDFYLDKDAASAASGSMQLSAIAQSPQHGYWFSLGSTDIVYAAGKNAGSLKKFSVVFPLKDADGNSMDPTDTIQNFVFVNGGVATNYSGNVYYDNVRLISYADAPVSISKVSMTNQYSLMPGVKTEFTCTARGGTAPYQYAFYVLRNGRIFWKSEIWTENATVSYTPAEAGDYTLYVYCRDAEKTRATYSMPLNVYKEGEVVAPDKVIALTFDDGPDGNADELLDVLKAKDVKATFFVLNSYAQYAQPQLQRIAEEGHQIGNHTYTHQDLTQLSEAAAREEITKNAEFIESVTGTYPKTYRPPFLSYNNTVLNYFPDQTAIGSSIDSRDWTGISKDEIIQNVVSNAKDGDIVLMHEPQANTRAAIGEIIDQLRAKGFEFVTVDELFRHQNVPMQGAAYYANVPYQMPAVSNPMTAQELVSQFSIGWNLGNTLDSCGDWISGTPSNFETAWNNPVTTKAMIDEVKAAGFQAIRVPTTWYQHLDASNNIDAAWMARVKEVVDYGIDNGMYVILNLHHEDPWLNLDGSISYDAMAPKLQKIWTQIANEFADYDQHLIFEVLNEPRGVGASYEWTGSESACLLLNRLNSAALKAIRATGGKNLTRCVMVPTYAASANAVSLSFMDVPADPYTIISVHAYTPYDYCSDATTAYSPSVENSITQLFQLLADFKEEHGDVPMILGEFGCFVKKDDAAGRVSWAEAYMKNARALGIPCFLWDNGYDGDYQLLNRNTCTWTDTAYLQALVGK